MSDQSTDTNSFLKAMGGTVTMNDAARAQLEEVQKVVNDLPEEVKASLNAAIEGFLDDSLDIVDTFADADTEHNAVLRMQLASYLRGLVGGLIVGINRGKIPDGFRHKLS